MKQGMTNVDVAAMVTELAPIVVGARFEKAYQSAKDRVLLRLRKKGLGRVELLFELGRFLTPVRRAPENPQRPSMVAKILRNMFENARVTGCLQVGFDRLVRLDMERGDGRRSIVFEVFGDGNLLVLDEDGTILFPMRGEEHGVRRLKKGALYHPPPGSAEPFGMDAEALAARGREARQDLVRFLALDLGFGPLWAEELCLRAGVDKKMKPPAMDVTAWRPVAEAIHALGEDLRRNDLAPGVVYEDGEPVDAVPFPMQKYPSPRFALEETATFREALETFFLGPEDGDGPDEDPRQARFDEARGRLQRQVDQMEAAIHGFETDEAEARHQGDTLYASFQQAQAVLDTLRKARETRSWQEVEATLDAARAAGRPEAQVVRELHPHKGRAVLRLQDAEGRDVDVPVDLRLSVQENADACYGAAKRARSRREGAMKALAEARTRLADLEAKGLDAFGPRPERQARQRRHFWFENYRWTFTQHGLLAVGGRNAAQNDAVVKKYLRDGDRYVHAAIHGAPSVVVRPVEAPSDEIPEEDLRTACAFAACSSRAWRQFGEASAYWVTAGQVNKTPRSGEFVPRGAWIVHGRRNTVDGLPMKWCLARIRLDGTGVPIPKDVEAKEGMRVVEKLAGGPPEGLLPFALEYVLLEPGDQDPNDAASGLAERFDVDVEEVQSVLPPGPFRVVDA